MYSLVNGRNQRGRTQLYEPMLHPYANYCTETLQKSEMKLDYENEIILKNLHLIPDPLKKNLADTLITTELPEKVNKQSLDTPKMAEKQPSKEDVRPESTLSGITGFFSGVFSMLSGAMFRPRSPVSYYDCYDAGSRQGSPPTWRAANSDVQDKNGMAPDILSSDANPVFQSDMNKCKTVSSCEDKLNQVKILLTPKSKPSASWRKRPKKVFVEPGSVEDSFEDAIAPEDCVSLPNEPYIEYYSPTRYETDSLCETVPSKTKLDVAPYRESTEIVTDIPENTNSEKGCLNVDIEPGEKVQVSENTVSSDDKLVSSCEDSDDKHQLVSSCEDKLSKLKALLQDKRKKNNKVREPSPEPVSKPHPAKSIPISKPVDKHYKNPHRMLDKRRKMKMKRSIQDDVNFANEIDIDSDNSPSTPSTITSSDTSIGDYFDELKGRFRCPSATESEDSFQIVFNDSPVPRGRASDCESEDSFIVFEDTDNCYTSTDVFGDSDSDSDVSDSGCSTMTCKLSHSLSRTVSNLTDDTLYESGDEVDCAVPVEAKGLLMNDDKKNLRKDLPAKKVHFSTEPPAVKVMRVWDFASRQARIGHWQRYALDRDRFKRRIADVDMAVSWVLKPQHRARVMFQRFMPWWNREKRRELAEKKEREEKMKEERIAEEKRIEERKIEEKLREENEKKENAKDIDADGLKDVSDDKNVADEDKNKSKEGRKQNVRKKPARHNSSKLKTDTKLRDLIEKANVYKEICDKTDNVFENNVELKETGEKNNNRVTVSRLEQPNSDKVKEIDSSKTQNGKVIIDS